MFNKNRNYSKKIRKTALVFFLMLQLVLLNSFTIYMSCFKSCCHSEKQVHSCCQKPKPVHSCCHEEKPVQSCSSEKTGKEVKLCTSITDKPSINRSCNCFHAVNNTDNFIVETQYSQISPAADFLISFGPGYIDRYPVIFDKQTNEIKAKSPPLYLSNSTFII